MLRREHKKEAATDKHYNHEKLKELTHKVSNFGWHHRDLILIQMQLTEVGQWREDLRRQILNLI